MHAALYYTSCREYMNDFHAFYLVYRSRSSKLSAFCLGDNASRLIVRRPSFIAICFTPEAASQSASCSEFLGYCYTSCWNVVFESLRWTLHATTSFLWLDLYALSLFPVIDIHKPDSIPAQGPDPRSAVATATAAGLAYLLTASDSS